MTEQDPARLIKRLKAFGMTEEEIADSLRSDGIDVTQATINRIKNRKFKNTSFEIGMGLVKLHERTAAQSA